MTRMSQVEQDKDEPSCLRQGSKKKNNPKIG